MKKYNFISNPILSISFSILLFSSLLFAYSPANSSSLASSFLSLNQSSNGQWYPNPYYQFYTSLPVSALSIHGGYSQNVTKGSTWLASNVYNLSYFPEWDNSSGYGGQSIGEDLGALLFALGSANYTNATLTQNVSNGILSYQDSSGGIAGYSDPTNNYASIADSSDTAWALIGMKAVDFSSSNTSAMLIFLENLQNPNGSENLTIHETSDSLDSASLDDVGTTALASIVFKEYGLENSVYYSNSINFLKSQALSCYSNSSYAYSAALATWALDLSNDTSLDFYSQNYLSSLQNSMGGFADSRRSNQSKPTNSIDTAAALLALSYQNHLNLSTNSLPCDNLNISSISLTNSTNICSLSWQISSNVTGPQTQVYASISGPENFMQNFILTYNSSSGLFSSQLFSLNYSGNYSVLISATSINGTNITAQTQQTIDNSSLVGIVNLYADGIQQTLCAQVPTGLSSECALISLPLNTSWQQYSFGDSLASISGEGCSANDAFCQCNSNNNACCLYWNLLLLNSSSEQWQVSQAGWTDIPIVNQLVFANVWGNSGRFPNSTSINSICSGESVNSSLQTYLLSSNVSQTNNTDALTCNDCTVNSQCNSASGTAGFCVHGICRSGSTYCGDGFCDSGETCSTCSADCGTCSTQNQYGSSGGVQIITQNTLASNSAINSTQGGTPNIYPQINSPSNTIAVSTTLQTTPALQSGIYSSISQSINSLSKQIVIYQQYSSVNSNQLYIASQYLNSARYFLSKNDYSQAQFYLGLAQSILDGVNSNTTQQTPVVSTPKQIISNSSGLFFGVSNSLATLEFVALIILVAIGGYYFGKK